MPDPELKQSEKQTLQLGSVGFGFIQDSIKHRSKTLSLQELYQVDIWHAIHHSISKHRMPPIGDPEGFILSPMGSKQLLPFALCSVVLGDVGMELTESKGNSMNWILPLSLPSMCQACGTNSAHLRSQRKLWWFRILKFLNVRKMLTISKSPTRYCGHVLNHPV